MNYTKTNEVITILDISGHIILEALSCIFIIFLIIVISLIICKVNNHCKKEDRRLENLYQPIKDVTEPVKIKSNGFKDLLC